MTSYGNNRGAPGEDFSGQTLTLIHEAIHDAYSLTDINLAETLTGNIYPNNEQGVESASKDWNKFLQKHCKP